MDNKEAEIKRQAFLELSVLEGADPAAEHPRAERIIVAMLRDLGHEDIADAWEDTRDRVGFWYE